MVGPLATTREPHSYDLCDTHARRLTVPYGWDLVRHQGDYSAPMPTDDDLVALANAVREAASGDRPEPDPPPSDPGTRQGIRSYPGPPQGARRHLRVVSGDEEQQR